MARSEVLDAIARLGGAREPGGRFAYRNSNYVVAAEIAERAGGRDIEALLAELVARPLGLAGLLVRRAASPARGSAGAARRGARPRGRPAAAHRRARAHRRDRTGLGRRRDRVERGRPRPLHGGAARRGARGAGRRCARWCRLRPRSAPGLRPGHHGPAGRRRRSWPVTTGCTSAGPRPSNTDDATGTTVAAVANVAATRVPAARVARGGPRARSRTAGPPSDRQSCHQSCSISTSLLSVLGAPTAMYSSPSGPASSVCMALGATRTASHGAELHDVVVDLDPAAAAQDDVDLLLLGVAVPERRAEVGRDAEVAQPGLLELERHAARSGPRGRETCRTAAPCPRSP